MARFLQRLDARVDNLGELPRVAEGHRVGGEQARGVGEGRVEVREDGEGLGERLHPTVGVRHLQRRHLGERIARTIRRGVLLAALAHEVDGHVLEGHALEVKAQAHAPRG